MAAVALVGGLALSTTVFASSPGVDGRPASSAAAAAADTERDVAASLQGVQVDVWDGGAPSPGRTTTMFVHRGDRALELYWTTDGWCVARAFTWRLEHVRARDSFDVLYSVIRQDTDCVMEEGDSVRYRVVAVDEAEGRTTWTGSYVREGGQWSVRTACAARWDAPSPCGFADAGALIVRAWPSSDG